MRAIDPKIMTLLKPLLKQNPNLQIETGSKHNKLRNLTSGDWLPLPGSSSDHRACKNFAASVKRLMATGQGFIHAKSGSFTLQSV